MSPMKSPVREVFYEALDGKVAKDKWSYGNLHNGWGRNASFIHLNIYKLFAL